MYTILMRCTRSQMQKLCTCIIIAHSEHLPVDHVLISTRFSSDILYRASQKKFPSDKIWHYRTKSWDKWYPFATYWSWWTFRFVYQNGIDRSRNAWAMSAWKRTSFAPTQGLHIRGYVPSKYRYCNSHISSYEWKTRQLRVSVTLFFPYFSHPYFIKAMEAHIGQHISQATEMQTLCGENMPIYWSS